jgi:hypothetical protein
MTTKDPRAEFLMYIEEDLLVIDETLSSEEQAELVFAWWKVCPLPVLPLILLLIFLLGECLSLPDPQSHCSRLPVYSRLLSSMRAGIL